jgi:hypothetical protein
MDLGNLADTAKGLAEEHADKVDAAVDKVAEVVDEKTGGKYTDQITSAADKVKDILPGA